MTLHKNGPWKVINGAMIDHMYSGTCLNHVAILIDGDTGTLLKIGTPEFINKYFQTIISKYKEKGLSDFINNWKIYEFDRYGFLNIDDICTIVNYLQNCISAEKVKELFAMNEPQLRSKIQTLQTIGF